jgi:hypothetical protein
MRRASFYKEAIKNTSFQSQLVDVLNNLENTYLELVGGKQWQEIGHAGMDQGSSFYTKEEEKEARVLATMNRVPWQEWVKTHAVCHHCGEKGIIRPKCPKYLADIESGKIICANLRDSKRKKNPPCTLAGPNQGVGQSKIKDPKVKAFLSAFQALFTNEDNDNNKEDNGKVHHDHVNDKEDDGHIHNNNDDLHAFLFMIGLFKE